ncbi:Secretion protein HlyD family protein [Beijerinckiaceae bacterium RH AL1]|nr:HlyD family secretion protein [Beijerinckiaceae bacterium]VVB45138.1 Secretion protein HlyD family protein [Beijerinckiaceae bacterium RH CH11]VVB45217.1 Secretion protein HlyD family protein [Beijerinckiaceae bacterium RH AL8]VVC54715.1 Secretion protein HlyD family protein [Beijerinckiaceae bacterium RH AL1]
MSASAPTIDDVTPANVARAAPLLRKKAAQEAPRAPDARSDEADAARPPRRLRPKRLILGFLALAALGFAGQWGWHWWTTGRFEEVTDDAFLQADKVTVAPKVGGFVAESLAADNQPVKAGDVIARIDDRDYQVTKAQDEADLDKSKASLEGVAAALIQQQAKIVEAKADVANTRAALDFARQEARRYDDLYSRGAGAMQRAQQADADLIVKQAALDKANAAYDAAQKQMDALRSLEDAARASLRRSQINLEQANLNLSYTTIKAPISGVVGDRALRRGQLVQPGTNLLTIVPMGEAIYLVANFKETQVGRMVEGQAASFTIDAFGDHVFHGRIDSFAPGTGSQFALLQPENATGNFTKIVQRVPVKIALEPGDPLIARLRPGLSAEATVDVRGEAAKPAAAQQVSVR